MPELRCIWNSVFFLEEYSRPFCIGKAQWRQFKTGKVTKCMRRFIWSMDSIDGQPLRNSNRFVDLIRPILQRVGLTSVCLENRAHISLRRRLSIQKLFSNWANRGWWKWCITDTQSTPNAADSVSRVKSSYWKSIFFNGYLGKVQRLVRPGFMHTDCVSYKPNQGDFLAKFLSESNLHNNLHFQELVIKTNTPLFNTPHESPDLVLENLQIGVRYYWTNMSAYIKPGWNSKC